MFNWVNLWGNNGKKRIFFVASLLVLAGAFVFSSVLFSGKNASAHDWDDGHHHHHHHHHKPDLMLAKYHFGDRWYKVGDRVTMHLVVKNRDGAGKAHHGIFVKDWIPAGLSDIRVHGHDWHCHMHRDHHHHDHDWDGDHHHHHYHHHDGDHHHHHHHHKSPVTIKCKYTGGLPVDGGEVLPHIKITGTINHHANKFFVNVAKVETRHDRNDSNNRSVETIKVRKHHHHHDHDHHHHDHHKHDHHKHDHHKHDHHHDDDWE